MLYSKIMVPFDGSEHAAEALEYAKGLLALDPEATLVVVHAVQTGTLGFDGGVGDASALGQLDYDQYKALVEKAVARAKAKLQDSLGDALQGLDGRVQAAVMPCVSVTDALARFAEEQGCDLIVMGRRGLGAVRGMIGSVSFGLLRETEIPIITVK